VADCSDESAVNVDHRQLIQMEVAQLLRHLLAIVERRDGGTRRARDLLEEVGGLGDQEVVEVDDARQAALRVHDE
jgi:hypothetical protein